MHCLTYGRFGSIGGKETSRINATGASKIRPVFPTDTETDMMNDVGQRGSWKEENALELRS